MGIGITSNSLRLKLPVAANVVSIPNGDRHYLEPDRANHARWESWGFNPQWG